MAKQAPQDMPVVRMLQLSSHRIGLALVAQHELAGALVAFREAAALSDWLVAQDPENQSWRLRTSAQPGPHGRRVTGER